MNAALVILGFLALVWTISVWAGLKRQHYVYGLFLSLVGLYEISGMVIAVGSESLGFLIAKSAQQLLGSRVTENQITSHCLRLAVFLGVLNIIYALSLRLQARPSYAIFGKARQIIDYWPHMILLALFGIIAVATGAGQARYEDYQQGNEFGAAVGGWQTVLFFGRVLLVISVPLLLRAWERRQWGLFIAGLLIVSPLVMELLIAGRRQVFVPSVILMLLYFLYSPKVKRKIFVVGLTSLLFITGAAILFSFRTDSIRESYGLVGAAKIYRPFFGEFVSISAISIAAETEVHAQELSYGSHLVAAWLDSIVPFVRIGDFLKDSLGIFQWNFDLLRIAPYGALSMYADAYLAFGDFGCLLLGVFLGGLLAWMHKRYQIACLGGTATMLTYSNMWVVCLTATLLMQYRSGLLDSIYAVNKLAFLFWVPIGLKLLVFGDRKTRVHSMVSARTSDVPPTSPRF